MLLVSYISELKFWVHCPIFLYDLLSLPLWHSFSSFLFGVDYAVSSPSRMPASIHMHACINTSFNTTCVQLLTPTLKFNTTYKVAQGKCSDNVTTSTAP